MNETAKVINTLSSMFQFLNTELNTNLPEPIFTLIPNRGKSKYYGWHWKDRWVQGDNSITEINITPDFLNRDVSDIMETLIHELCHYKNAINGIKDCNNSQYHNRAFKKQAEEFGLTVEKMRNKGWAHTSLGERAKAIVEKYKTSVLKGTNPFVIYRVSAVKPPATITNRNKKMVSIDKELAERLVIEHGGKLSDIVEEALMVWENKL